MVKSNYEELLKELTEVCDKHGMYMFGFNENGRDGYSDIVFGKVNTGYHKETHKETSTDLLCSKDNDEFWVERIGTASE